MTKLSKLNVGDIVQNAHTGDVFVVVESSKDHVLGISLEHIIDLRDWAVLSRSTLTLPASDRDAREQSSILAFSDLMLERLRENRSKGNWDNETYKYFLIKLATNLAELSNAFMFDSLENAETIARQAADVANYCMMIADRYGQLSKEMSKENKS